MECDEIKELLSDYVDDLLDAEPRAIVDQHLLTCTRCQEELDSLRALVRELAAMKPVEPPKDFLNQLHMRLEKPSKLSRILHALFVPMRVKVPIELAAAAVMVMLVSSLVLTQKQRYKMPEAPVAFKQDKISGKIVSDKGTGAKKNEAVKFRPALRSAPGEQTKTGSKPLELALLIRTEAAQKPPAPSAAKEAAPGRRAEGTRSLAAGGVVQSDERARFKETEGTIIKVKELIGQAQGKVLSTGYEKETQGVNIIDAEIPSEKLHQFYDGLRDLGDLKLPAKIQAKQEKEMIQVRISLIPSK